MELLIIRHGQSANNVSMMSDLYDRMVDPPLTELGRQQAERVAQHLAEGFNLELWVEQPPDSREVVRGFGITRLYCSPMLRTLQTAQPIGAALGLRPEVWLDIHEHGGMYLDYGDERGAVGFPGMGRQQILTAFPNYVLPDNVTDEGWWRPARGAEDIAGCMARALRVAGALRRQASSVERFALVTHGTFADCLLKALLDQLPSDDVRHYHYNTGISRVDFLPNGRVVVRFLNRVDHLPPELVS